MEAEAEAEDQKQHRRRSTRARCRNQGGNERLEQVNNVVFPRSISRARTSRTQRVKFEDSNAVSPNVCVGGRCIIPRPLRPRRTSRAQGRSRRKRKSKASSARNRRQRKSKK